MTMQYPTPGGTKSNDLGVDPTAGVVGAEEADISSTDATPSRGSCRAVYVGTSGALAVTFLDDSTVILPNVAAGIWHPMAIKAVVKDDTDATDIFFGY
jgi:hypothetical protein